MLTGIAAALLVLFPAAAEKKVAMILAVKGTVTLEAKDGTSRPAKVMDLLVAGDRLTTAAQSEATLIVLGDNHRERLKPNTQVTVSATGCTPADAVQRQEAVNKAVAFRDVSRLSGGGLGAVVVLRRPKLNTAPVVTPMSGATVLTGRPTLSWQPVPGATEYRVRLVRGQRDAAGDKDQTLWTARTKEPRLPYPEKEKALQPGREYSWSVIAQAGKETEPVAWQSQFTVATPAAAAELAKVKPLAASKDPADLLLAALTYHEAGVYEEALRLFEKLAQRLPKEARLQFAVADYYERAGRLEESEKALERAKKLWPGVPPK